MWENAEYKRVKRLSHMAAVENAVQENEERDRQDMKERLEIWDDDESDELFYVDRYGNTYLHRSNVTILIVLPFDSVEWRRKRQRVLQRELTDDTHARNVARAEEERAQRESQMFLERQMEEMRATQEEQKRAGLLVDDAAPIKLNVLASKPIANTATLSTQGPAPEPRVVFGPEDEEDIIIKKKRVPLVELDFIVDGEKAKEKLENLRTQVTRDKDALWKAKIRWEAISDVCFESI
jgi:RNA-binding protein 25